MFYVPPTTEDYINKGEVTLNETRSIYIYYLKDRVPNQSTIYPSFIIWSKGQPFTDSSIYFYLSTNRFQFLRRTEIWKITFVSTFTVETVTV